MKMKWKMGLFLLFLLWILAQGVIGIVVYRELKNISDLGTSGLRIKNWINIYKTLSLGTYKIEGINKWVRVIDKACEMMIGADNLKREGKEVLNNSLSGKEIDLMVWKKLFKQAVKLKNGAAELKNYDSRLAEIEKQFTGIEDLELVLSKVLGYEGRAHYIVLTQNNTELWPTGGYLGSYMDFYLVNGTVVNLKFEDIGVPNGQIKGYVDAPTPIEKYTHFGDTPGWRLRESNWEVDFTKASKTIEWFFTEGGVEPVDGMIAINLIPVIDVLKVVGEIQVPDYNLAINADNFYQQTQVQVEEGFFDGSTQKRDFLSAVGKTLLWKLTNDSNKYTEALLPIVYKNLTEKQIMIAVKNESLARFLRAHNFDGALEMVGENDYIYVNEANLGINKTNCCIVRQFKNEISWQAGRADHKLSLYFKNNNPATPNPPYQYGGGYKAWVRILVPEIDGEVKVVANNLGVETEIEKEEDKTVIGFLVEVGGGHELVYKVEYKAKVRNNYALRIQKQSGIDMIPWTIEVKDKDTKKLILNKDMLIEW